MGNPDSSIGNARRGRCRRYRDSAEPRLTCLNPPPPPCQSSRSSPATARLPIHRHLPPTSPGLANAYFNPASALLRICSAGSSPIRPLVVAILGSFLRLSAPFWPLPPLPLAAKLWLPDPQLRPNAPSSPNLLFFPFFVLPRAQSDLADRPRCPLCWSADALFLTPGPVIVGLFSERNPSTRS
jgi:hypothetical protein